MFISYTSIPFTIPELVIAGLDSDVPSILQEAEIEVPTNEQCSLTFFMLRDTNICAGTGTPSACRVIF